MAQEHQEYIQNKVNPTLENLVTQVLLDRPDNPVPFMIQWLAQQTKAAPQLDSGEAERLRIEIASLGAEVGELEAKVGPNLAPAAAAPAAAAAPSAAAEPVAKARADDDDEEEEEDDDEGEDLPPPTEYLQKKQRTSVSAEAYGAWNQQKPFTAPVYEKTEDQKGRLTSVLKMCFLFQALSKADLDIIVDAMIEKSAQANERIIQEGADGDCMYVVEKGNIECLKVINEVEKVVKSIGPGGFFGELALLYNCPRAASVEARDDAVLWQLDRETFNHIVRDASMKQREMYEQFLNRVPLLETLGENERGRLADSFHKEIVAAGTVVIKQGDTGSRFYLVEKGELSASKGESSSAREVLQYKPGDYFGELALIKNESRAATVVAKTDCELLWLDNKTFKSLLGPLEDILAKKANDYVP